MYKSFIPSETIEWLSGPYQTLLGMNKEGLSGPKLQSQAPTMMTSQFHTFFLQEFSCWKELQFIKDSKESPCNFSSLSDRATLVGLLSFSLLNCSIPSSVSSEHLSHLCELPCWQDELMKTPHLQGGS